MYTRFASSIVFPLHERLKKHDSVRMRRELERSQWYPPERLQALQIERLRGFLADVRDHVPYYRAIFSQHRFEPAQLQSVSDLKKLPFLDKATIRDNGPELQADDAGRLTRFNTGGSTGEPLVFLVGRASVSHDVAAKWRATRWWGVDIGDVEVVLWGSPIELGGQDRIKAVRDRIFRSHLLPAFQMGEEKMDEYLARIRELRPRMLFGYASALALLAAHAERIGAVMTDTGIKVAFTTGETLYPPQRAAIERVFGTSVANGYGSRDAGFIAHQCPEGSLHVSSEHIIVEIVDEEGEPVQNGRQGEVVITHLSTRDFPFIRYRTGDVAVFDDRPCACGRGLPVLREVFGRSTDFIRTRSGNTMHALALIYEVRDRPGVKAFKFVQEADLSLELQLVGSEALTPQVEATIREGVLARMGEGTPFKIRRVVEIPPENSGKYRYVSSKATGPGSPLVGDELSAGRKSHRV